MSQFPHFAAWPLRQAARRVLGNRGKGMPRGTRMETGPTLSDALAAEAAPELGAAVSGICRALAGWLEAPGAELPGAALSGLPLRWLLRPAPEGITAPEPAASLAAALKLLPGEGAVAPRGALFSLRPAIDGPAEASFLAPPPAEMVAGCLVQGAETLLALALGGGAALYALDLTAGSFACIEPALAIPADVAMLAAELGSYRHWDRPVRRFADECFAGAEGPLGRDCAMRWSGALASDAMTVLRRGGICLVPGGARPAPSLILEGQPLARLAEAAGGRATDGEARLLDRVPRSLGETRSLAFGSPAQVARLAVCHDLPDADISPLFGRRGLFRS